MSHYYVSKFPKASGDHEVHTDACISLPRPENRLALGVHETSQHAVQYARLNFRQAVSCHQCCSNRQ